MARQIFYHNAVKNVIVAFGSLFDEVRYINDFDEEVRVPLGYAPKSKFIEFYNSEASFDTYDARFTLPRMAFEMTGLNFASERFHNPLSQMQTQSQNGRFMYARIPYDFNFNLYLATKTFEDSLKIIEQITPYFTPEITVTLKDMSEFELATDIPIVLNSTSYDIQYEGSFEDKRTIEWTLGFTVKGYLYSDVKTGKKIKESIISLTQEDINRRFVQLVSEVIPRVAEKSDPHIIKDTTHNPTDPYWKVR